MKKSDLVGLSFYAFVMLALELVARNRRPSWWGWLMVGAWIVSLIAIVVPRLGWMGRER